MAHSLAISFVNNGQGCYFTVSKGKIIHVTTHVMPAEKKACFNALSAVAVNLGVPEGEHAELWTKMKAALENRATAAERRAAKLPN